MIDWIWSEVRDAFAPSGAARFALDLSSRRVALVERTLGGGRRVRGSADHAAPDFDAQIAALRGLVSRRRGPARVDILLPPELTLFRVDAFPDEARHDLRREAWWRLDRWAPYRPEELCYDVAALRRDKEAGVISAAAAVAPREIVEEAIGYARRWGFRPQRVSSAAEHRGFPQGPVFFEVGTERRRTRSLAQYGLAVLLAAAIVSCIGAARAVALRDDAAAEAESRLRQVEAAYAASDALRRSTLALASEAMRPSDLRARRYLAGERMRMLGARLPQGVTLDQIVVIGDNARIVGRGASGRAVVAALSADPAFIEVAEAETAPYRDATVFAVEFRFAERGGGRQ